ncbi:1-phosphofructokinase [Brachyspira pilosicoli]|uniref:1-phosphofructokinase n=1 Tax=Brachyspira pilosicoli TaxID=52584 RepID=UPI000E14A352|nr:1-phosphofructokinase [Brachyspira pilosicoli]WIH83091.1 1-phosphofructokinase [Brachyspira pilosicoli]WIH85314.1 1-phosphofructokinase [Brachyspira pilosicoli]SUW09100.1 fructose-1-phosphate kinase [Brachyspira pilosicoli]
MIYTLTLNPAVDYYIDMESFEEGDLNKVNNAYTLAGGKGINVSKVLKNFNIESIALGFCGGFTGDYIKKDIKECGIKENFIYLEEATRINIKLKTSKSESEIAGKSPNISKEKVHELLNYIKNNIKENDILVLSGSVPNSIESSIYKDIISNANKNIKVILDARDEAFKIGLREKVFLTKPNKKELGEYFNKKIESTDDIIKYARELIKDGSKNVIVSLGKDGSVLVTENEVYIGNAPKGKLISSVGAGDSMVAGIVYGLSNNLSIVDSYKYAIASGSSTACSEMLTTFENMNKFLEKVEIKKIN